MARANLSIADEIISTFHACQESAEVRFLKVCIREESLVLVSTTSREGSADHDWNTLLPQLLDDKQAAFVIYRFGDQDIKPFPWLLLAWVPDNCKVRDKMLYSSSREDLKRSLGLGYFKGEYSANTKADIVWSVLQQFLNRDSEKHYSAAELAIQYEKKETLAETRSSKSAAMGLLPINVSEDALQGLQEFAASACNFVEISVANETLSILAKSLINPGSSFKEHINEFEVRFYLIRSSNSVTFMYSCPENASIKMKMQGSSFKATVSSIIKENGVSVDKSIECRDKNDLEDTIIDGTSVSVFASGGGGEASTKAAAVTSARPRAAGRPGTNRGKVAKFVGDDEAVAVEESV